MSILCRSGQCSHSIFLTSTTCLLLREAFLASSTSGTPSFGVTPLAPSTSLVDFDHHSVADHDTPRSLQSILNVIRKATSKPSRSISRSSAKSSTLTAKASSSKKKRSTYNARRVVSDSPSSSPLTPRPSRGIVKRNPKPRGLGAAPALVLPPLVIKAEKTVLSRRSSPRNPVTPAPVQPTHKLPPSSDADDERDEHDCDDKLETDVAAGSAALATRQAIEVVTCFRRCSASHLADVDGHQIDLSEAQTSSRTEQISKRATAPSPVRPLLTLRRASEGLR